MKKITTILILLLLAIPSVIAIYRFNLRKSIPENVALEEKLKSIFEQNDCYACHSNNPKTPFYGNFQIGRASVGKECTTGCR